MENLKKGIAHYLLDCSDLDVSYEQVATEAEALGRAEFIVDLIMRKIEYRNNKWDWIAKFNPLNSTISNIENLAVTVGLLIEDLPAGELGVLDGDKMEIILKTNDNN